MALPTYQPVTGSYHTPGGAQIDPARVRSAVDTVIDAQRGKTAALTERLRTGQLPLHEWEAQLHADLKALHVAIGTVAYGGTAQMSPAFYGFLGSELKKQYGYANAFAQQIAAGQQRLDGTLGARADLYPEAARGTYYAVLTRQAARRGATQARRVLRAAEHCAGCATEAAKAWVPLGSLAPLGSQACRSRCRCQVEYDR